LLTKTSATTKPADKQVPSRRSKSSPPSELNVEVVGFEFFSPRDFY
jgi:hypothetical protein